jgi:hypothetical protein
MQASNIHEGHVQHGHLHDAGNLIRSRMATASFAVVHGHGATHCRASLPSPVIRARVKPRRRNNDVHQTSHDGEDRQGHPLAATPEHVGSGFIFGYQHRKSFGGADHATNPITRS